MEKKRLQQLIGENKSILEIAETEGLGQTTVRYWLKKHGLKTNYNPKYTKETLEAVVENSKSYNEVLRKLGRNHSGGTWYLIKRKIQEFQIDTSHFLGKSACAGELNPGASKKKSWQEILVAGHLQRVKSYRLRRALLESGREYKCEDCDNDGNWKGKELRLQVDHKNGDWSDCRKSNLRFLCPNCHDTLKGYATMRK